MPSPIEIFVKEMRELFQSDEVYIVDGSQEEAERLTEIAQKSEVDGRVVLKELNGQEYPNSYYHCSNPNDVARTERLTFVCAPTQKTKLDLTIIGWTLNSLCHGSAEIKIR
ncbi:MAG: hypothetical protein LBT58_03325 [Endomicrobium sp.]|jgi:phosphoenolpyruvate carboxykinase (GTP)|nr:hypothetical protein [Endomicrobium sp.]